MNTAQKPVAWTAHAQASANNYVILQDNHWVAAIQFNGELMPAKQDAYASQMAASGDLLAALESLLGCYQRTKLPGYPEADSEKQAKAAIKKAEGQS